MIDDGSSAAPDSALTRASSPGLSVAESIGPYRLLQPLGEGGMGTVWLAEQTRPIRRQVALKIIKAGMDTAQVVARFEAERQALALMEHPAIARVFDAGATPQGRPYFAMEYVHGESITAYCARQKVPLGDRLGLFLQVCDGVQHAHQRGVIHRDLKPSNILVAVQDDHPVPKIIDFGVAKAITRSLTDRTLQTELGSIIGTPEYMSPEQAEMSGLDVDTRTDVYALGAILYELLTGTPVFEALALHGKSLEEIRRTIREVDPPRPSTRATTRVRTSREHGGVLPAASALKGDLDWIVMKALEKDRTRRYGSASDIAADVRRHLNDQPVLAGPPSTTYRLRKFARRHRLGVTTGAALAVLLVAFVGSLAVQARRIAQERDRANREAAMASQVSDFLVGLFRVSDPSEARGNSLTARELLDKGAVQIDQSLRAQPDVQARLQLTIGTVYTSLGLYASAEPMLRRAIETLRRTGGGESAPTLAAEHDLADLYWYQERYSDAEALYEHVVAGRIRILGLEHRDSLKAKFDLASVYLQQKRWDAFDPLASDTLRAQQRVLGETDPDTISSMNNLASSYYSRRRYGDALPIALRVLSLRTTVLGPEHPLTYTATHNVATNYDWLERPAEAEAMYLKALAGRKRVLGVQHPLAAQTVNELARMHIRHGRYREAEALLLGFIRELPSESSPNGRALVPVLVSLYEKSGESSKAAVWRAKLPGR
jgi:eukaryotic-like serine/threonine-protein kinase